MMFLTGTFVLFASGVLDSFDGMALFIAMTDSSLLSFIFQKFHFPKFMVEDFTFTLLHTDREKDSFYYIVSSEDFNMMVCISGIDTTKHCGPLSNIDFVHFVWKNFLCFSYKKYAVFLSLRGTSRIPKMMCLKYYRAESEGWKNHANCDGCVDRHMIVLSPYNSCILNDKCSCNICMRKPPSLADFTRHVLFNFTLHIDRFKLTDEKTNHQYVYAVRSNRELQINLLPPEGPTVRL